MERTTDIISLYDLSFYVNDVIGLLKKTNYQQSLIFSKICDMYYSYNVRGGKITSKIRKYLLSADSLINVMTTLSEDGSKVRLTVIADNKKVKMEVERFIGSQELVVKTKNIPSSFFDPIKEDISLLFDCYEQTYKVRRALEDESLSSQKFERSDSTICFHTTVLGSYINVVPKNESNVEQNDALRKTFIKTNMLNSLAREILSTEANIQRTRVKERQIANIT